MLQSDSVKANKINEVISIIQGSYHNYHKLQSPVLLKEWYAQFSEVPRIRKKHNLKKNQIIGQEFSLDISETAKQYLENTDKEDFDIFHFRELSQGKELESVLGYLLTKSGGFRVGGINVAKYKCFATAIQ